MQRLPARMLISGGLVVLVSLVLAGPHPVHVAPPLSPHSLTLDAPYFTSDTVTARLNNAGQMVGGYWDRDSGGFLWSHGRYTLLHVPHGVTNGLSDALNDKGQVVGGFTDRRGRFYGFLLNGKTYTALDFPGAHGSEAAAINDRDQVVGSYQDRCGHAHGFLWYEGVYHVLDVPDASDTEPASINDAGEVAGTYRVPGRPWRGVPCFHAFLLRGGVFRRIDPPDAASVESVTLSGTGQVLENYMNRAGHYRGFLWGVGASRTVACPDAEDTFVQGLNDQGDVVGWCGVAEGASHAFLYSGGVYHSVDLPGAVGGADAYAINDRGQIAGSYVDSRGSVHGFLWDPVIGGISRTTRSEDKKR